MCVIPTRDSAKARAFFEGVLGLPVEVDDGFATVLRANNATIRLTKVQDFQPLPFTLMGWEVADMDGKVRSLAERGVVFEQFPGVEQDDLGIWTVPGAGAKVAWFKDPDGNLLSLSSH
jgi:catechol 2,3-dioxygenase-like lactoylglutathione lyase family enzyme